jgi:hypothetical protein
MAAVAGACTMPKMTGWIAPTVRALDWCQSPLGGIDYRLRLSPLKAARLLDDSLHARRDRPSEPYVGGYASSKSFCLQVLDRPYERRGVEPVVTLSGTIRADGGGCRITGSFRKRGTEIRAACLSILIVHAIAGYLAMASGSLAFLTLAVADAAIVLALKAWEARDVHRTGEAEQHLIVGRLSDLFDAHVVEARIGLAADPPGFDVAVAEPVGAES